MCRFGVSCLINYRKVLSPLKREMIFGVFCRLAEMHFISDLINLIRYVYAKFFCMIGSFLKQNLKVLVIGGFGVNN